MSTHLDISDWKPTDLWEYGRKKLGYGEWDPLGDEPWYQYRNIQVGRLTQLMKRRGVTPTQWVIAVDYCHRHRLLIKNPAWVFKHIPAALTEKRTAVVVTDIQTDLDEAIGLEQAEPREDSQMWIARLTRARGPYREEVLNLWRQSRPL